MKNYLSLIIFCFIINNVNAQPLAFPGAEGYGRFTTGGRGGKVIEVTNLNDSGAGSFRAALRAKGKRIVVFRLSGTIELKSPVFIQQGDITIAGQTAPGDGICISNYPVLIDADNVIVRYIRFRLGDKAKIAEDALSGMKNKNIIIDHCSMSWGIDECSSFYDNENFTMQWCIISESLHHSWHHKGDHGYGGIWGGKKATFHHNLLAHHFSRNPRFNGSRTHGKPAAEIVDFRNNVIYNWGDNSSYGGEAANINMIANYYKAGPATKKGKTKYRIVNPWDDKGKWYIEDNVVYGFPAISKNNWAGGVQGAKGKVGRVTSPHPFAPVITQSAEEAFHIVLRKAGAVLPKRDTVDARIVREVLTGTATYSGSLNRPGIIDSQDQAGGWPVLHSIPPPVDSDHDGMPDEWEKKHRLDPTDSDDRNEDNDGNGFTNLEDYLNELCHPIN